MDETRGARSRELVDVSARRVTSVLVVWVSVSVSCDGLLSLVDVEVSDDGAASRVDEEAKSSALGSSGSGTGSTSTGRSTTTALLVEDDVSGGASSLAKTCIGTPATQKMRRKAR